MREQIGGIRLKTTNKSDTLMNRNLENKVAVIVGESPGIDVGAGKRSTALGARGSITGRRQSDLRNVVVAIEGNLTAIEGDAFKVTDIDRINQTVKAVAGRRDLLFVDACFFMSSAHLRSPRSISAGPSIRKSAACSLRCRRRCTFFRTYPRLSSCAQSRPGT